MRIRALDSVHLLDFLQNQVIQFALAAHFRVGDHIGHAPAGVCRADTGELCELLLDFLGMTSSDADENICTHPSLPRLHGEPRPIFYILDSLGFKKLASAWWYCAEFSVAI